MDNKDKKQFSVRMKNVPQTPQKLRLVADVVRGTSVEEALGILSFLNKKGAHFIRKAIQSGVANAKHTHGLSAKNLVVSMIFVDEASVKQYKRYKFVSRGRVAHIIKRRSYINLTLLEK